MISLEKWMILTPLQKLPENREDYGKLVVAKGFKLLPKVQNIAQSGHTGQVSTSVQKVVFKVTLTIVKVFNWIDPPAKHRCLIWSLLVETKITKIWDHVKPADRKTFHSSRGTWFGIWMQLGPFLKLRSTNQSGQNCLIGRVIYLLFPQNDRNSLFWKRKTFWPSYFGTFGLPWAIIFPFIRGKLHCVI